VTYLRKSFEKELKTKKKTVAAHRRDALYCFWATFKFRAIFILVAKLKLLLGTCTDSLFFVFWTIVLLAYCPYF
jgi:hypothetical protein